MPEGWRPADGQDGTVFLCALCGMRFTHGGRVCGMCPLGDGCNLIKCPRCDYTFPRSSRIVDWWRRLRAGRREEPS